MTPEQWESGSYLAGFAPRIDFTAADTAKRPLGRLTLPVPRMVQVRVSPILTDYTVLDFPSAVLELQYGLGGALFTETVPFRTVGNVFYRPGTHFRLSLQVTTPAAYGPSNGTRVLGMLAPVEALPPQSADAPEWNRLLTVSSETIPIPPFAYEFVVQADRGFNLKWQNSAGVDQQILNNLPSDTRFSVLVPGNCTQLEIDNPNAANLDMAYGWVRP